MKGYRLFGPLVALAVLAWLLGCTGHTVGRQIPSAQADLPVTVEALTERALLHGFEVAAIYTNDRGDVTGARFFHPHTRFTFDFLRIESVPQAFIWINTIPDSDRGEPHILEHLVLGKGNKARFVSALEDMWLVSSSAFTARQQTCYHFHTTAGAETFFSYLRQRLDSLLFPDFDDEEIRREVHHFNVSEGGDGGLHLEEGGTVYTEMVTAFERPANPMWHRLMIAAYGPDHPLAKYSGGIPRAIRETTPEHIHAFHRQHYQLANMGMIGAFPSDIELSDCLTRIDGILRQLQPEPTPSETDFVTPDNLPAPQPIRDDSIQYVDFPNQDAQEIVELDFIWPAVLDLDNIDLLLLEHFFVTLAGAANTNLYRRLIDSDTREIDTGATAIYTWVADWQGHPINLTLEGIPFANMNEDTIRAVQAIVLDELQQIASWSAGDPRLVDFNRRFLSNLTASERDLRDFLDSPPRFGYRSIGDRWLIHLARLAWPGQFQRSLSLHPEMESIRALVEQSENIWTRYLDEWQLLSTRPAALVPRPSPDLLQQLQGEREGRLATAMERLIAQQEVDDPQEALVAFKQGYDAETQRLEQIAQQVEMPAFIDTPPLTLDDFLSWEARQLLDTEIPVVRSFFPNMSGATYGIALRLDGVSQQDLVFLAILPALIRHVGVVEGEEVISYEEMIERLQNEVLNLSATYSIDYPTGRVELLVEGSGTNQDEMRDALQWMQRVLFHPDWRPENLSRIRDLVSETLDSLRTITQGREEDWVQDPADSYRWQSNPLILATSSFLTRTHNVHRLRWMLMEAEDQAQREQLSGFLEALGQQGAALDRDGLRSLLGWLKVSPAEPPENPIEWARPLAGLTEGSLVLVREAASDLDLTLDDLPDETLAQDWQYLCRQMAADLALPPAEVLDRLENLRQQLLLSSGSRVYAVGAPGTLTALQDDLAGLVGGLDPSGRIEPYPYDPSPLIRQRLLDHSPPVEPTIFVGLVNPNTQGGVFLHSAPAVSYRETDQESLLRYLTSLTYAGGGNHGVFMNTWAAGLAYSNGVGADLERGLVRYYAERCPELPQTLRFVIDLLRSAEIDPRLTEYALAQAFRSRSAARYEVRGRSIAADLADDRSPELIRGFREALLEIRHLEGLPSLLHERMEPVYGTLLPGYGPASDTVDGAVYFVIGPERQLALYEEYLRGVEGENARLFRLYPRDFWMVADLW